MGYPLFRESHILPKRYWFLFLALLGFEVCWGTFLRDFVMMHRDVIFYADVSRNMIEGHGFATDMRFPYELPFIPVRDGVLSRDFVSFFSLAHPFLLWVPFKLTGVSDYSIVWFSILLFLLALIPLFFLTRKFLGDIPALLSCVVYLLDPWNVSIGFQGYTQVPFILLILWGSFFFFQNGRRPDLSVAASAVLFTLASYFREESRFFLMAALIVLLFLRTGKRRFFHAALMIAVYAAGAVPVYLHRAKYFPAGPTPYSTLNFLNFLGPYDNWIIENLIDYPPLLATIKAHLLEFVLRSFKFLFLTVKNLVRFHPLILFSAAFGFSMTWRDKKVREFLVFIASLTLMLFGLYSLVLPLDRYPTLIAVFLTPFAGFGLYAAIGALSRTKRWGRPLIYAGLAAVFLWVAHWAIEPQIIRTRPLANIEKRQFLTDAIARMGAFVPAGSWVITENPPLITWYMRRPTIGLFRDTADYSRLEGFGVRKPVFFLLGNWYEARKELFDPLYQASWDHGAPLLGNDLLLRVDSEDPKFHVRLFGPDHILRGLP
jgi:hypothetical protein